MSVPFVCKSAQQAEQVELQSSPTAEWIAKNTPRDSTESATFICWRYV
jgi:hypothetical protein